tara:strand:- start:361 stop:573 length:213 start_codon:yes stop_codon:yes gene_type:complete
MKENKTKLTKEWSLIDEINLNHNNLIFKEMENTMNLIETLKEVNEDIQNNAKKALRELSKEKQRIRALKK